MGIPRGIDPASMTDLQELLVPRMVDRYMPHVPHEAQQLFLTLNCREALYGGSAGSGKSDALLMAALQYVDIPGYSALMLRRTYADLALPGAIMDRLGSWLRDTDARPRNKGVQWIFPSGARITFGYLQHSQDKYRYQCMTPDHDVLTERGWVPVDQVTTQDHAATVNPQNGRMEYRAVNQTFAYDAPAEGVYAVVMDKATQLVTHNHTLFYRTTSGLPMRSRRADRIPIGSLIPTRFNWVGSYEPDLHEVDLAYDYLVEHQALPDYIWKWTRTPLIALLRMVRNLTQKHLYLSEELLNQIQRLAVHAGVESRVMHTGRQGLQALTFPRTHEGHSGHAKVLYKETVPYRGKVYCVEVKPWHTLVVRHRGSVTVTGNSAEFQAVFFDELTQFQQEDYEYLFSRLRKPSVTCLNCDQQLARQGNSWAHTGRGQRVCNKLVPDPRALQEYKPGSDGVTIFDVPLRMRSATNPGGIGGAWVKEHFIDPRTKKASAVFIPAKLEDNPSLNQEEYRASLMHLGPVERERLLNGDWDVESEGGFFERHWFNTVEDESGIPVPNDCVRSWDLAATPKGGDYTVGAKVYKAHDGRWYIADIVRGQWTPGEVERVIKQTAERDGRHCVIHMEQEPGSSGVAMIDYYRRQVLVGYTFYAERPTGSKDIRARPLSAAAEAGNVHVAVGPWTAAFLDEAVLFPHGDHDDQVDAVSAAMNFLAHHKRSILIV